MNPNQSSQCWRGCGETMATHSHIFWQCPLLDNFWKSIFTYINKVLNVDLIRDPLIAILGIKPVVIHSRKKMYLLQILLIILHTPRSNIQLLLQDKTDFILYVDQLSYSMAH
uniref:Uncharacterized protein n=2 Tax=Cyprinus carpio TaxID=7962 RepID=A0A8C1HQQ8_CYPCA